MKSTYWDERYSEPGFAYGKEPIEFLVSVVEKTPQGKVFSLAEGEGRNAVYLASRGYQVTGVDGSAVGLRKAVEPATERDVREGNRHSGIASVVQVMGIKP